MATQAQNLSREMILPAYKPAISPGPPPSHTTTSNSATFPIAKQLALLANRPNAPRIEHQASRIEPQASKIGLFMACKVLDKCRESSTNRPFFVQTNPILSAFYPPVAGRRIQNPLSYKGLRRKYQILRRKSKPKRTQNKAKRTQFFASQRPPKPKRTQANPKQTQFYPLRLEEIRFTRESISG